MSRYIDADRLIAHLKDEIEECDPKCGGRPDIAYGVTLGLKSAIAFAEALSADVVEVRHGVWRYNSDAIDWGLGAWECSICGCINNNLPCEKTINPAAFAGTKYCPNCGAKMDGERREQ